MQEGQSEGGGSGCGKVSIGRGVGGTEGGGERGSGCSKARRSGCGRGREGVGVAEEGRGGGAEGGGGLVAH